MTGGGGLVAAAPATTSAIRSSTASGKDKASRWVLWHYWMSDWKEVWSAENQCHLSQCHFVPTGFPVQQWKKKLRLHPFNGLFFLNNLGKLVPERLNQSGFKWGKRLCSFGKQLHQLDHMQTICTSLQTDNHTNISSLNFYRPDALSDA